MKINATLSGIPSGTVNISGIVVIETYNDDDESNPPVRLPINVDVSNGTTTIVNYHYGSRNNLDGIIATLTLVYGNRNASIKDSDLYKEQGVF